MTDTTVNSTRTKALELAIQGGGPASDVVARATAYHTFLNGAAAAPAAGATKPTGAAGAPATGAATKPTPDPKANGATAPDAKAKAAAAAEKVAAEKAAAAKAATDKTAADKAAAAKAPKAAAKGATPPSAQAIPADTKAPGGKNTYADVVAMLHKVQSGPAGRPECFKILLEDGGAAKSVRDLKPAYYDAVVEACTNVIADDGAGSGEAEADESDPLGELGAAAGGPERDEMGLS